MDIDRTIAHYRVVEKLGEGGMGVVWKARDTHLDRFVALKLLPPSRVGDPERRRRFVQEAKTASALQHPNIVHIYDIGEAEGALYIAMEYIQGQTLDRYIADKSLTLGDTLKYAAQLADAMAAAHAAGVVHRDLKPSNVLVTDDGLVKVMDFGIAKLANREALPEAVTAKMGSVDRIRTEEGLVLGTAAYMSPEQAEGKRVDARSDIFSFGVVLYELLTGVKPFRRESQAATLAAILNEEPRPLRELAPGALPELERLLARCLRKDPERRLRSMADLGLALRELKEESDSGRSTARSAPEPRREWRRAVGWIAGLVAVILGAMALLWWRRAAPPTAETSFKVVPLTTYPGVETAPSLSSDGSQVAFSWNGEAQQNFDIYVKTIGPGPPLRLTTDPAEDGQPAWSPDGSMIAFLRTLPGGYFRVLVIPPLGGPERKVAEVFIPDSRWLSGPYLSWLPDSQSLVITDKAQRDRPTALFLVSSRTGERRQLTFPPAGVLGDGCVAVSPDGDALAFCRSTAPGAWSAELYTMAIAQGGAPSAEVRRHTFDRNNAVRGLAWSADNGGLALGVGSSLWTLAVPNRKGASEENPTKLEAGEGVAWPTVARHSKRLVFAREVGGDLNIWRLPVPGPGEQAPLPVRLIASTRGEFAQQYSPDGKRIAFESHRSGNLEIWICDSDGANCGQLTWIGSRYTGVPAWSPDGRQIAFYSRVDGHSQILTIGVDGGAPTRLTSDKSDNFFPRWSRDGQWIYFASNRTGTNQVWKIPPRGGTDVQVTRQGGFAAAESPDGKWLYFTKNENADTSLWRMPAAGGEETPVLESVVLFNYAVVEDGIYFIGKATQGLAVHFHSFPRGTTRVIAPVESGYVGFSVSPDRKWILYTVFNPRGSDLMLVENFR
jgi:eukaryotic-like serine/threonine-protein kinase